MSDVAAAITFHREGLLAPASIASFMRCCDVAEDAGIRTTRIALLDRPDQVTLDTVQSASDGFDQVEMIDVGDLGKVRNHGLALMEGDYVAFFDGDDLWGEEWISKAYRLAKELDEDAAVFHPRVILYFNADDYHVQSQTAIPQVGEKSYFMLQPDSRSPEFDPRALVLCNIWTSNSFGPRAVYEQFPYLPKDTQSGFGVEDWSWNMVTLASGVRHVAVADTVHCVRVKPSGSLGSLNDAEGILPKIHEYARLLEDV